MNPVYREGSENAVVRPQSVPLANRSARSASCRRAGSRRPGRAIGGGAGRKQTLYRRSPLEQLRDDVRRREAARDLEWREVVAEDPAIDVAPPVADFLWRRRPFAVVPDAELALTDSLGQRTGILVEALRHTRPIAERRNRHGRPGQLVIGQHGAEALRICQPPVEIDRVNGHPVATRDVHGLVHHEIAGHLFDGRVAHRQQSPVRGRAARGRDDQIRIHARAQIGAAIMRVRELRAFHQQRHDPGIRQSRYQPDQLDLADDVGRRMPGRGRRKHTDELGWRVRHPAQVVADQRQRTLPIGQRHQPARIVSGQPRGRDRITGHQVGEQVARRRIARRHAAGDRLAPLDCRQGSSHLRATRSASRT